jgi:hypothetical protein
MIRVVHKPYTKEECMEESLKYNTRLEFQIKSGSIYNKCKINGWLDDACQHMTEIKKSSNYWTKERCQEESLKYNTRREFQLKSGSAYSSSLKNGWLDEICSHMKICRRPDGYWTKEKCKEESSKYRTRYEFQKNNSSAYIQSRINKWLDEFFPKFDFH